MIVPTIVTILFIFVKEQYVRSEATGDIGASYISPINDISVEAYDPIMDS